jgi:hypothetical protein
MQAAGLIRITLTFFAMIPLLKAQTGDAALLKVKARPHVREDGIRCNWGVGASASPAHVAPSYEPIE